MQMRFRRAEGERWLLRPVYMIVILSLLIGTLAPSGLFKISNAAAVGPALYPDLKTTRPSGLYFDRVTMSDGLSHYVLRFSNTVWNDGEGRLELQGDPRPDGSSKVYQNVYDSPSGGTRVSQRHVSSDIVYHPSHYHYHFQGFASYLMLKRDSAGVYQATTKKGTKTGFCIMDSNRISSRGSYYAKYTSCNGSLQGISVGWGDLYQGSLPEQWIDLGTTRLADGYYAIQSTADPQNKLNEAGRDGNNVGLTYFRVSGGTITIGSGPAPAPVTNPSGTMNPSFSGSPLAATRSWGTSNGSGSPYVRDNLWSTSWYTVSNHSSGSFTIDYGQVRQLTGVRWGFNAEGLADQFTVDTSSDGQTWSRVGTFGNGQKFTWYGIALGRQGRYVKVTFTNPNGDPKIGYMAEIQLWGTDTSVSSAGIAAASAPTATATPSPTATATPSPTATPTPTPTATPTPGPTVTPTLEPTATATPEPTATATLEPMVTPTLEPTPEPTATTVPTEQPTATATPEEPVVIDTGVIVNTAGDRVRCRTEPSTDGGEITTLAEGDPVPITGEVVGEGDDRWVPVICGDSQAGFIAARFVGSASELTPSPEESPVPEATETVEDAPATEEGAPPEELAVTEAATVLPYAIADVTDSEQSGTGALVVDGDRATTWQVSPAASPTESWLLLDLGAVLPVERVSIELGYGGSLAPFELWLSEDGSTWWNVAQRPGWDLAYDLAVNAWARYVMIVVPDVAGLDMVGGIGEVGVWPAGEAGSLANVGSLVTPEPAVEESATEATEPEPEETSTVPTEEWETEGEATSEETIPDQSGLEDTFEETPTPEI